MFYRKMLTTLVLVVGMAAGVAVAGPAQADQAPEPRNVSGCSISGTMQYSQGARNGGTSTLRNCNGVTRRAQFTIHNSVGLIGWDTTSGCTSMGSGTNLTMWNALNSYATGWQYC